MSTDDTVYLHSTCHIKAPVWCYYKDGVLTLECSICKKYIASFIAELIEYDITNKDN